ncbi:MAG TPA: DUF294 nucleotidyltransferase-like domain-containing protein [Candidatus Latescibacteria bacterium]|nr:DUF294 nucleotidyltransferase-like domain-containing protein [Candidatus Latescibacterota bacterium]
MQGYDASESVRVDLHLHSRFSDGLLSPTELAARLSEADVRYASLTDHETIEGLGEFRAAASRLGIVAIPGVELTTLHNGAEVHLLGYGFNVESKELNEVLARARVTNNPDSSQFSPSQRLTTSAAIDLIHHAGGSAFVAHPLQTESDPVRLRSLLDELRGSGLDGVEAYYGPFPPDKREEVAEIASGAGLLVCGGSDGHGNGEARMGVDMPLLRWKEFRNALIEGAAQKTQRGPSAQPARPAEERFHWRAFLFHIAMPAFLAVTLFVVALFAFLLPYFERTLIDRKRENIRELTQTAWSVLDEAEREVSAGNLTREQAQTLAIKRVEAMRYGPEGKDYFWLQDLTPRIIMHPYRRDLNGHDVSQFRDPNGIRIFVEFADLVRKQGEGYVSYVWQWKDDPERMEPKESYIRLFAPWGWVIGTGIYVHDVQREIAGLRQRLVNVSLGVTGAVLLLLLYIVRQSVKLERARRDAERRLRESTDRYRALTSAATEGALFVVGRRCAYANPVMSEITGYTQTQLELVDVDDLFPAVEANIEWRRRLDNPGGADTDIPVPGVLQRRDGTRLACSLSLRRVPESPRGYMILARNVTAASEPPEARALLNRLLLLPEGVASDLTAAIQHATKPADVVGACLRAPKLVRALLENGASPMLVTRVLAELTDEATRRLIFLATEDIGPAPCPYSFLALGSQGRQSQTLYTDQDNALLYELTGSEDPETANRWFLELGQRVCTDLARAGFRDCRGGSMASNPRWCQPLPVWKRYFEEWIRNAEPREVMEFSIFFDFRSVDGDVELSRELRRHVTGVLRTAPHFFAQAAQNALQFKPPLRLFGSIVGGRDREHSGLLDLKSVMMPIVSFARLYALQQGVEETSTLDRLNALTRLGILLESKRQGILAAYEALLRLRLRNQSDAIELGRPPDNWLDPKTLGRIEEAVLHECFNEIDLLQERIRRDFLAG